MAKIYTTMLAAGALLLSGIGTVGAVLNSSPAVQTEREGESETPKQKPYGPEIDLKFEIDNDEPRVEVKLVAPSMLMGDWTTETPEAEITGTMTIKLVKWYQNSNSDEREIIDVKEWTDVSPKEELTFTDSDIKIGRDLRYRAIAIVDGMESEEWYGSLGVYTGIRPLPVEDFILSADKGQAPVTGSFTIPDGVRDAEDFPGFEYKPANVYVTRSFRKPDTWDDSQPEVIWEQSNPEVNTTITFIDDNNGQEMPEGTYTYSVYVAWQWGESFENSKQVGLYQDAPGTPEDIVAAPVEEGVLITWSEVTKASGIGYLDPASVTYDVYRYFGYNDTTRIATDLIETKFIDDLKGIDKQIRLAYQIIAKNEKGTSSTWGGISNEVIVGPACQLPFEEKFSDKDQYGNSKSDMLWSTTLSETGASWNVASKTTAAIYDPEYKSITIEPSEGYYGLAYTNFASWYPTGETSYISGDIDFKGHDKGLVTFRYYGHPDGLAKLYVDVMRYDESDADEAAYETVWSGSIKAEEEGWIEETVEFSGFESSDKINLRLRAVNDVVPEDGLFIPVCVEYISVDALGTQKPYGPDIELAFQINNDEPRVEGTIVAPTMLMGNWETGAPDAEITGTMKIKLVKWYQNPNSDEREIIDVKEWTNVSPKEELTFTDYDIEIGRDLRYRAIAIVAGLESEEWYGSLGVYTGIRPLPAEGLTLTADKGQAPVNVSFTIPDGVRDAEDFPGFEYKPANVYVTRSFREVDSWDDTKPEVIWAQSDPEVNTTITFIDDNKGQEMPEGTYTYSVYVAWQWGESFESSERIGLYQDAPGTPEDIVAASVEEGVLITWSEVTKASGIGYLDPSSVTYDVYRYFGYNDVEVIAEDLIETKFIDDLKGIDKQIRLAYQIIAKNEKGTSSTWEGVSNEVIVGPACELPFVETFSGVGPWDTPASDMLWTTTYSDTGASWAVGSKASAAIYDPEYKSITIEPSEGYKALAYTNFASWYPTGETSYISGDIDFKGHDKGKVTFRYYGHPNGLVKLYVDVMRYDEAVADEAGEAAYETVWSGSINAEEEGWIEETVEFSGFASSDKINLRLRAVNDVIPEDGLFIPACVEYIKVEATDGTVSVSNVAADEVAVEYYDMKGMRLAAPVKGQPIIRKRVMSDGTVRTSKVILK